MSGRTRRPWTAWPMTQQAMYFPRLANSKPTSSISTILAATRNIIPSGAYLQTGKHEIWCQESEEANIYRTPQFKHSKQTLGKAHDVPLPHDPGDQHHGGLIERVEELDKDLSFLSKFPQGHTKRHSKNDETQDVHSIHFFAIWNLNTKIKMTEYT